MAGHDIGYVTGASGSFSLANQNMVEKIRDLVTATTRGTASFTGSGLNDCAAGGTYTGLVDRTYRVQIDLADAVDTFKWSKDGGVTWAAEDVAITGAAQELENGVTVTFTATTGHTLNDYWEVACTSQGWTVLNYDTSGSTHYLILKGCGLTGQEEIFVGFIAYHNADADYYNIGVMACTGYVAENSYSTQPNAFTSGIPANNNRIDYWLTWNSQRIAIAKKVDTPVYESGYVGKFLPYARPSQFPYPICCGGMLSGHAGTRSSDTSHSMPYKGNRANFKMRTLAGTWYQAYTMPWGDVWITCGGSTQISPSPSAAMRDTGGEYHLTPVELYEPSANLFGALDGIYHITGFNNAVENTVTIGGKTYVIVQDVWRTGFLDYYAMRLD